MFLAKVIGHVWSTIKWDELSGLRFLLVRPYHLNDLYMESHPISATQAREAGDYDESVTDLVVAADILGACIGEDVVIAYGHAGRAGLEELLPQGVKPRHPIDAAIVAIVDNFHVETHSEIEKML